MEDGSRMNAHGGHERGHIGGFGTNGEALLLLLLRMGTRMADVCCCAGGVCVSREAAL